jgi:peptide-methionine (R)-S-oxide reductase
MLLLSDEVDAMTIEKRNATVGRRAFLIAGWTGLAGLTGLAASLRLSRVWAAGQPEPVTGEVVSIENFDAAGKSEGVTNVPKIVKSDAVWRGQLSALAFDVTRKAGTEAPYSGEYAGNHADGLYHCICCGTVLFDSKTKFESGTGWPSFWQAISRINVVKSSDSSFGMQRDAISCRRCDAHLGHVFDDGPRPTGLRYCMNSVSLHFTARA